MTLVVSACVAIIFAVSLYMLMGKELKGIAMGVFLLSHAANLSIIAMSGSPVLTPDPGAASHADIKAPPLLTQVPAAADNPLAHVVDPLPQALILTAIVIGFGVMGFLLSLVVVTGRATHTLDVDQLAAEQQSTPSQAH